VSSRVDPAEVQGHGGGGLAGHRGRVVDADRPIRHLGLGHQWLDLGYRAPTKVVFPTPKPAADHDLDGDR